MPYAMTYTVWQKCGRSWIKRLTTTFQDDAVRKFRELAQFGLQAKIEVA